MKKNIFMSILLAVCIVTFLRPASGCALSCAAICRYTCQGTPQEETGCTDQDYSDSLQRCCEQAFRETPGIQGVECPPG